MSARPQDIPLPAPASWQSAIADAELDARKDTPAFAKHTAYPETGDHAPIDWSANVASRKNRIGLQEFVDWAAHTEVRCAEAEALREPLDPTRDYEAEILPTWSEVAFVIVVFAILLGIVLSTLVKSASWLPGA